MTKNHLPNPSSKLKNPTWLLLPIILVGSLLRFWHLGIWSFWSDEVLTVMDAQQFSMADFQINPIPYLAVKLSMWVAGTGEWGARFIPCLAGIASIPLIFLMGRSLFNTRVGLFAASFLALSSWHLFWSQNARSYVFTFLFAMLTAWGFFLALERDQWLFMAGSLVAAILLILSHTLSVMLIPALAGYVFSFWLLPSLNSLQGWGKRSGGDGGRPIGIRPRNLLIFFLPFALPVSLLALPRFRHYLFSGWGLNEWGRSSLYVLFTLVHGLSVPIAVAAFFTSIAKPMERAKWFLLCYAGVPLILFLIASRLLNVAGYYLFFTAPAYFLLAAIGCDRIWGLKRMAPSLRWILPCVVIVTMLAQDYIYFRVENGGRPKWREAFSTIRSEMREGDRVVVSVPRMSEYYLPGIEPIFVKTVMADAGGFERKWKAEGVRVWFVFDVDSFNVFDSGEGFRRWVYQRARLIRTYPVFARAMDRTIGVYLWENK